MCVLWKKLLTDYCFHTYLNVTDFIYSIVWVIVSIKHYRFHINSIKLYIFINQGETENVVQYQYLSNFVWYCPSEVTYSMAVMKKVTHWLLFPHLFECDRFHILYSVMFVCVWEFPNIDMKCTFFIINN
jgi:amino acid permease